jgi:hypothetical protein
LFSLWQIMHGFAFKQLHRHVWVYCCWKHRMQSFLSSHVWNLLNHQFLDLLLIYYRQLFFCLFEFVL